VDYFAAKFLHLDESGYFSWEGGGGRGRTINEQMANNRQDHEKQTQLPGSGHAINPFSQSGNLIQPPHSR
jgi:hypothetical protein